MQIHIVHAHPEPKSFCSGMKDAMVTTFETLGHRVSVADLHAMDFAAVADADDFSSRATPDYLTYALEQRQAYDAGTLAFEIADQVEKVLAADLLVLNAPMYWFSVPAIMKGWIDRVFLSGPFYGGKRIFNRGGLTGKQAMVTMTLGSRPHMFGDRSLHGDINVMMQPILRSLGYVGFDVVEPYYAYHVPYLEDAARAEMMTDFCTQMADVSSRPVIAMPSLDDFDDQFRPR